MDQDSLCSALSSEVSDLFSPSIGLGDAADSNLASETLIDRLTEETRMAFNDSVNDNFATPYPAPARGSSMAASENASVAALIDDDSQASRSSTGSTRKRKVNADEQIANSSISRNRLDIGYHADRLYEYQWPENSGEYFLLQEQITEFLGIKSFKRKYPDFYRRQLDYEERIFLKDQGVADGLQGDLGLTALKSEDVIELMAKEYPSKYCEYLAEMETRQQAAYSKKIITSYHQPTIDKSKMSEFIRKSIKSVSEYNQQINQERREDRSACMDLQTYILHYPIGLGKENRQLINNTNRGRVRRRTKYPVATLPGQYQDWYVKYTPQELKYFPINTVLYGPVVTDPTKLPPLLTSAEESSPDSDSDDSVASDDRSCCSSKGDKNEIVQNGISTPVTRRSKRSQPPSQASDSSSSGSSSSDSESEVGPPPTPTLMKDLGRDRPNATCKFCKGNRLFNKDGMAEELVHCYDCQNSCHPRCLDLTTEMVDVIRSYPWQCSDCKACVHCSKAHEEDKMMFCDKCDRGYHTFCVGLLEIPTGKWVCRLCAQCAQCGTTTPVPKGDKSATDWQHETIKIISPNGETLRRHQLLCVPCYKQRRK
ncbi:PHD finger protein 10 [Halotydeus destructor]|nr:PHD finger protein 10 [Halotydeus destructor]